MVFITHFALDVVEGEHAVGVSALSLNGSTTLARAGRAESGTHNTNWSSEAGRRRRRDTVPVPRIHDEYPREIALFPTKYNTVRPSRVRSRNGFSLKARRVSLFTSLSLFPLSSPVSISSPLNRRRAILL